MSKKPVVSESDDSQTDIIERIVADNDAELLARNKKLVAATDNYTGKQVYTRVSITVANRGIHTVVKKDKSTEYFRTEIAGKTYNFAKTKIKFDGEETDNPVTISMSWAEFAYREQREFSRIKIMAPADLSEENKNPLYSRESINFIGLP